VFHGTWGCALFQSVYKPADDYLNAIPLMPEWFLLAGLLAVTASLGFMWAPLLWLWSLFFTSILVVIIQAMLSAYKNVSLQNIKVNKWGFRLLIALLHIIQPIAKLYSML